MSKIRVLVGGSVEEDAAAFVDAWRRASAGETVRDRVVAFESWEGLAKVMTEERYRLLRHVHARPAASISALARDLHRQYRRVHDDVSVLEKVGLLDRSQGSVRATADRISAEVRL